MKLHFIVTAGPTREHLDPVRFLSNPSTGKMGFAVARAAARRGHDVVLVAGPCSLPTPKGVRRVNVVSAREMKAAVDSALAAVPEDIEYRPVLVATAAVADWRPETTAATKLKKSEMNGVLRLVRNPDILAETSGCLKIGFAAETGDALDEARRKCRDKHAELIVLNDVTAPGAGFGTTTNIVTFVPLNGNEIRMPLLSKSMIATKIVRFAEKAASKPNVMVLNGWAASEAAWEKCEFRRERIYSYRDHLSGATQQAFDSMRGSVAIVAWSMGVSVALELALRNPSKIRALVLLAGTPCMMQAPNWKGMSPRRMEALKIGLKWTLSGTDEEARAYEADTDENLDAGLAYLVRTDLRDKLMANRDKLAHIRVVIMQAARDPIVRMENAQFLESLFKNPYCEMLDIAQHALPLACAKNINWAIKNRLGDNIF